MGIAYTFGGPDLDVLYMTCSATSIEDYQNGRSVAYVAATRPADRSASRIGASGSLPFKPADATTMSWFAR